jgi:hypothetical protein
MGLPQRLAIFRIDCDIFEMEKCKKNSISFDVDVPFSPLIILFFFKSVATGATAFILYTNFLETKKVLSCLNCQAQVSPFH